MNTLKLLSERNKMRKIFVFVLLAALLAVAAPVGATPDNYCTTVTVTPVPGGTYNVSAVGAGRYARVRDLTSATTVVATDFGAGATSYSWTGLVLDAIHQYQVQVSHTSLNTGYSTSGCVFTPPPPLGVDVEYFAATRLGLSVSVEWQTVTERDATHFDLYRGNGTQLGVLIATMQAHPGSQQGYYYSFVDNAGAKRASTYTLVAWATDGSFDEYVTGVVAQSK